MLLTARHPTAAMPDPEDNLRHELHRRRSHVQPLDGLLMLSRRMENEHEDQFDVDLTILDFLVYKATDLVFEWRESENPHESDLPNALVTMTGEWRTFLSYRHHGRRLTAPAAFRSRLLQFLLVFTHRMQHDETWTNEESLNELREQNKRRGEYWEQRTEHSPALQQPFDTPKRFPLSDGALYQNRNDLASAVHMPQDQRRWVADVAGTPSLHCLLPLFIELTAARVALDDEWEPTEEWLDLAGEFMLQATTEEYLRNGAREAETFNTIFSFGAPGPRWAEEGSDVTAMRRLFCDEDTREEKAEWSRIRQRYITELAPPHSSTSSLQAIYAAQERRPYKPFEIRVISFLQHLHEDLVKPDLAQVEEGRFNIHGTELSADDSRDMMRRMGL